MMHPGDRYVVRRIRRQSSQSVPYAARQKPRRVRNTPLLFFGGTAVHPDKGRFRERMEMQFEPDERG